METQALGFPEVVITEDNGDTIIWARGMEWPVGPHLRVRECWRSGGKLPAGVLRQRGIAIDIYRENGSWEQLAFDPHASVADDGVCVIGPTKEARAKAREVLIDRARNHIWGVIDDTFYGGY